PAPAAARRAPPGAEARSSSCSCESQPFTSTWLLLLRIAVMLLAHHTRHDLPRFNADRLIDNSLLIGVVAHLHVARQRKILAERVPDETIVREDAPQVGVPAEHDPEQIESLPLVPVGGRP